MGCPNETRRSSRGRDTDTDKPPHPRRGYPSLAVEGNRINLGLRIRNPNQLGHHKTIMANSLISPITIDGTAYCCKCYGTTAALGRGTKGIKTDSSFALNGHANTADITNDCSPWDLLDGTAGAAGEEEGEITFGVSCGTTVAIDLEMGFFGLRIDFGHLAVDQIGNLRFGLFTHNFTSFLSARTGA